MTDTGQIEANEAANAGTQALVKEQPPCDSLPASSPGVGAIDIQVLAPLGSATHAEACCTGAAPLDHRRLTAALNQVISTELGLRGFMLTLAVEKARTVAELRSVAQRTVDQIRTHHGDAAAAAARHTLDGA